jgi:hypothetical protein
LLMEATRESVARTGGVSGKVAGAGRHGKRRPNSARRMEKWQRQERALAQPAELKQWQETAARGRRGEKIRDKELRVSTTEPEAVAAGWGGAISERAGWLRAGVRGRDREIALSEDHFIVAERVTLNCCDAPVLTPLVEEVEQRARAVATGCAARN